MMRKEQQELEQFLQQQEQLKIIPIKQKKKHNKGQSVLANAKKSFVRKAYTRNASEEDSKSLSSNTQNKQTSNKILVMGGEEL